MSFDIVPLTPRIGAELLGIDLSAEIGLETLQAIHDALMEHKVVFFRDQDLTPQRHGEVARLFGRTRKAQRAAFDIIDDVPEMAVLINDEDRPPNVNHYHSDGIFRRAPEFGAMLYGVEVPPAGGDTIFVDMERTYEELSDHLKAYLSNLTATHDFMKLHGSPAKQRSWTGDNAARMDEMRRQNPPVSHPMIRTHPVTGRRSLYVAESFTTHIDGISKTESDGLLQLLFKHCTLPEFQCRFHWRPGSMAFWDNRATQHYAVADYWPQKRLMHRVTIETDDIGAPGIEGVTGLAAE